jgi:general nucleoside transport system permease protein
MKTTWERVQEAVLPTIVALLVAIVCGDLLILSYGQDPGPVYRMLLEGTWGNWYGFGQVLYKATTLAFTGMAVAIGLRAGLFNIGAEGQIAAGGLAAAMVGLWLPATTPQVIAILVCIIAAGAAGGGVAAVPAVLKTKFGAHEVIVTIMLNFVVLAFINWLITTRLAMPESLHTATIHAGFLARLDSFFPVFHGSAANLAIVVAIVMAVIMWIYLFKSRGGYELRAAGLQPDVAEYGGISVHGVWMKAMIASGMIAGIGGVNYVLGYEHYYEDGFATGSGFLGIAVALVGRNHPFGVLAAALLFATLSQGGLAIHAFVPKQIADVLQAIVIIAISAAVPEVRRLLRESIRKKAPA